MTRQDKIKLLNDIATGKMSIDDLENNDLSNAEIWFWDAKTDIYTNAKTGEIETSEQHKRLHKESCITFQ